MIRFFSNIKFTPFVSGGSTQRKSWQIAPDLSSLSLTRFSGVFFCVLVLSRDGFEIWLRRKEKPDGGENLFGETF